MKTKRFLCSGAAAVLLAWACGPAGCGRSGQTPSAGRPQDASGGKVVLRSAAFAEGKAIPRRHSGDGEDLSPPLSWSGVPAAAKELALIVDDPDAPTEDPWVHWVVYKIPPATTALAEGVARDARLAAPASGVQGKNSWNAVGYRGPAPPKGHGVHHYHFKLYALDAPLDLKAGADKKALLAAMAGHVLAEGRLIGTYQR
jgi:Raf kinase inhibitor-like YbhB/YbcL family protein